MKRPLLVLAAAAAPLACAGPEPSSVPLPPAYSVVFLETGPATDLAPAEVQRASTGHQQNIRRLGEEGVLLIAGPFGEPRVDPRLRGLFVFDAPPEEALEATATDPAVQAGVFTMAVVPWRTEAPLRRVRELEKARLERGEEFTGRAYVLGTGTPVFQAFRAIGALSAQGVVPFHGQLGGERREELLFALVAETPDEARALLEAAPGGDEVTWNLSSWYATRYLADLAAPPAPAAGSGDAADTRP